MQWIVVMNRAGANLCSFSKNEGIKIFKTYENPLGRLKNSEMEDDKPGSSPGKFMGSSPHSMGSEKSPHDDAALEFAKKMAASLETEMNKDHSLTLKIVAGSKLYGMMKGDFNPQKLKNRIEWIDKDLANIPTDKWPKLIGLE